MPQGKGTYGSKGGRPPKKKYNKGGNVDPFSTRNPKGVPAEQLAEAMENQNRANKGLPTTNARDRMQTSPDTEQYNKGGKVKSKKVDITDIVKDTEELKAYNDIYTSGLNKMGKNMVGRMIVDSQQAIKKKKKEILKGKKK